jgi:(p)ppGpp synthase/HD superfamily hydrolase
LDDLGERFGDAMSWALELHASQRRKGTAIPYAAHLLAVTALVLEDGGDEDEAIGALLHDAVEDGKAPLAEIRARYGDRVAEIVDGCSDTDESPKPPWRARKDAYIAHLAEASPSVVRVSLADKLHNARAILLDYRQHGDALWTRFDPKSDQLWYYRSLAGAFEAVTASPMLAELIRVVRELEAACQATTQASR